MIDIFIFMILFLITLLLLNKLLKDVMQLSDDVRKRFIMTIIIFLNGMFAVIQTIAAMKFRSNGSVIVAIALWISSIALTILPEKSNEIKIYSNLPSESHQFNPNYLSKV